MALAVALGCGLMPASAAEPDRSAEDRRRFVSIARQLEEAPLEPRLEAEREWALEWLTETPDVTVNICGDALGGLLGSQYRHGGEIVVQNMFSMAAFMIEHPEAVNDPVAQQMAGVEGALKAYRSILRVNPEATSPALDSLLQTQSRGALPDFVREAWTTCARQ
jgi:hypothetical protein